MPAYTSHSIMAERVHKILKNQGIPTEKKTIRSSAVIPDLVGTKVNNHNSEMQEYILFLIQYIKKYNLVDDINTKSMLYGIICHYYLDTICHPFIYNIDFNTKTPSAVSSHFLIEGYLNYYLSLLVNDKDILKIGPRYSVAGKLNENSLKLLDSSYKKIYKASVLDTINMNAKYIYMLEVTYKRIIKNNDFLASVSGFNDFLKINEITTYDLDNRSKEFWINPFTNQMRNDSFMDLFNDAVREAVISINQIESYFRDEKTLSAFDHKFNKSYDTGTSISLQKYLK